METRRKRLCREAEVNPEEMAVQYIMMQKDPPFFHVEQFAEKGRGVVADQELVRGHFLLEYHGDLIPSSEGDKLEEHSSSGFRYFFHCQGKHFCMDATSETAEGPRLGRLVNHGKGKEANARMRAITYADTPRLCLFATRDIQVGAEILYDYGIKERPWEKKTTSSSSHSQGNPPAVALVIPQRSCQSLESSSKVPFSQSQPFCQSEEDPSVPVEEYSDSSFVPSSSSSQLQVNPPAVALVIPQRSCQSQESSSKVPLIQSQPFCQSEEDSSVPVEEYSDSSFVPSSSSSQSQGNPPAVALVIPQRSCQSQESSSKVPFIQSQPFCQSEEDSAVPVEEDSDSSFVPSSSESDSGEDDADALFVVKRRRLNSTQKSNEDGDMNDPISVPASSDSLEEGSDVFPLTGASTVYEKSTVSMEKDVQYKKSCTVNSYLTDSSSGQESCKNPSYKKPYRFCIYCKTFKAKLTDHLSKIHKDEERVRKALQLPTKQRIIEFDLIKKEGTFEVNKQRSRDGEAYEMERASSKEKEIIICGLCSGAYASSYMKIHKRKCEKSSESCQPSLNIPASLLKMVDISDAVFISEVLGKFRKDDIGLLCRQDTVLVDIGRRLWSKQKRKLDKRAGVRKSVMTDMRRLAGLYLAMKDTQGNLGPLPVYAQNVSDLMQRSNFRHLEEAVEKFTECEKGSDVGIKAGLKLGLFYLLKSASKILKATFLMDDQDSEAEQIDKFTAVLNLQQNNVFGDATYHLHRNREEKLRRPSGQSLESDIKRLREYTTGRIDELVGNELVFIDKHRFVELRDCIVARLTLFNARRGGEPSRLFIKCWQDAKSGAWLDKQQLDNLDPIDKAIAQDIRVGYQTGKGRHLVPVLFPKDTHKALDMLMDEEIRSTASVRRDNTYLFPTTSGGDSHVSGWHALDSICDKVTLEDRSSITATKNRHRVSVLFALADVPDADRGYIFKHLGHSEETNRHVYQAPLAIKEITVVGKQLQRMDASDGPSAAHSNAEDSRASLSHASEGDSTFVHEASVSEDQSDERTSSLSRKDAHEASVSEDQSDERTSSLSRKVHKYTKWRKCHEEQLFKHFEAYLKGKGNKRLPGKKEILAFLKGHPSFPHGVDTTHNKMMNEVYKRANKFPPVV